MRNRVIATAIVSVVLVMSGWAAISSATLQPAVQARVPANHSPIAPAPRTAHDIGDLTASVATSLPATRGGSALVERTLIDRQLMAAWARHNIPHAPLSD